MRAPSTRRGSMSAAGGAGRQHERRETRKVKRLLYATCVVALTSGGTRPARAQRVTRLGVPASVRHAWSATYSGVAQWQRGPGHSYDAFFVVHGVRTAIRYADNGQVVETRTVIGSFDLPDLVKAAVLANLRGYQIAEVWRVKRLGRLPTQYVVDCDRDHEKYTVRFDADGTIVSREKRVGAE